MVTSIAVFAFLVSSSSHLTSPSPPETNGVVVTQVVAYSPDNACGLDGVNEAGFTVNVGEMKVLAWFVPASQAVSVPCTVTAITTNTSGFELYVTVPFTATTDLTILTVEAITYSSYNGPLNLTFS